MKKTVLVTGGAGYIGSHMTNALTDRGERVIVLDNLSSGVEANISAKAKFVRGDVSDEELVRDIIGGNDIGAVMHFAGSTVISESVERPLWYYENNLVASQILIKACVFYEVPHFIFSSSAAAFGNPNPIPVPDESSSKPTNSYGRSKWMVE